MANAVSVVLNASCGTEDNTCRWRMERRDVSPGNSNKEYDVVLGFRRESGVLFVLSCKFVFFCGFLWIQAKNKKQNRSRKVKACYGYMVKSYSGFLSLTVSRDAEARRSGRKPTSSIWSRKLWSSMPYTLSRKSTIGALWSGQKLADMSGSVTEPSKKKVNGGESYQNIHFVNIVLVIYV